MNVLKAIYTNAYDLLVDDGSIAIGTILALAAVGVWSWLAGANEELRSLGGPLLFCLLMGLLLTNLYVTGQKAAQERTGR